MAIQGQQNSKSDVDAKKAFCEELRERGYSDVKVTASPADITATLNGERHFFEIKYTAKTRRYFGAATLTEWIAALENADRFAFVIAWRLDGEWQFEEYTLKEFMEHSYVPPFKIFFNVPVGAKGAARARKSRTVLTHERLTAMRDLFHAFKSAADNITDTK
jgi:Holliday junction resolvase